MRSAAVAAGAVGFVALDRVSGVALELVGLETTPPAVLTIIGLAAVSTVRPASGRALERALGPSAAYLRAALPLCLTPMLLQPLTIAAPSAETVPKFAALVVGSALGTMLLAGTLANRLLRPISSSGAGASAAALPPPSVVAATRSAARGMTSPRFAAGAMVAGVVASAFASALYTDAAITRGPAYAGATIAAYVLAGDPRIPSALRTMLPPTVCSGLAMAAVALAIGPGVDEVRVYLDGAGAGLMGVVSPALGSLGLLAHTYRDLLRMNWRALIVVVGITAPLGMLCTAFAGRYCFRLAPAETAAVLPATTTTGLALTMGPSLPFAQQEWIVLGPNILGVSGMVLGPLLYGLIGGARSPLVRGVALGSVMHVGVMSSLLGAGHIAASEAAAISFFLLGTTRCALLATPFAGLLGRACGVTEEEQCGEMQSVSLAPRDGGDDDHI